MAGLGLVGGAGAGRAVSLREGPRGRNREQSRGTEQAEAAGPEEAEEAGEVLEGKEAWEGRRGECEGRNDV